MHSSTHEKSNLSLVNQLVSLFTQFIENHYDYDEECPSKQNEIDKLIDDPEDYFNTEIDYLIEDTKINKNDITQEIKELVLIELLDIYNIN